MQSDEKHLITRRSTLFGIGFGLGVSANIGVNNPFYSKASLFSSALANENNDKPSHGFSIFGTPQLSSDFAHLPYVNPDAPKGGTLTYQPSSWAFNQSRLSFNSFNGFILKGDAPPRIEWLYDSLMARSLEEPDAVYGLVARDVSYDEKAHQLHFKLRSEARFHDGTPLTSTDVAFSYHILKEYGHPNITNIVRHIEAITPHDAYSLSFTLKASTPRSILPLFVTLPIFPKHFYEKDHSFESIGLTRPLGSGPYTIGDFNAGQYISYERVKDYWAQDLPINRGLYNFDSIRIDFFRDPQIAFESFKKGDISLREEFSSRIWAQDYDFPAVLDGRVQRRTFPDKRPSSAQGYFLNMRRPLFKNAKVREALGLCFDFNWANQQLFFDLYKRTHSFFENSPMKALGKPSQNLQKLLEPFQNHLPQDIFNDAYTPPSSDGSGQDRALLRRASQLLDAAGFERKQGQRIHQDGTILKIEFLESSPAFERITLPFIRNLERIGVQASFRLVDSAQFQNRLKSFDFDIITRRFSFSSTPGAELRQYFYSESAMSEGSQNFSGVSNPAVDYMIERVEKAKTREALTLACQGLDHVLRSLHIWIPQWYKGSYTLAYWDHFGMPSTPPQYGFPYESLWWDKRVE